MMFIYKSRFKEDETTDIDLFPYNDEGKDIIQLLFTNEKGGKYPVIDPIEGKVRDVIDHGLDKLRDIASGFTSGKVKVILEDIEIEDNNINNFSFPTGTSTKNPNHIAYIVTNAVYHDPTHFFIKEDKPVRFLRAYDDLIELRCQMIKEKEVTKESLWAITYLAKSKMPTK